MSRRLAKKIVDHASRYTRVQLRHARHRLLRGQGLSAFIDADPIGLWIPVSVSAEPRVIQPGAVALKGW